MKMNTTINTQIDSVLLAKYFKKLVNHFFKILPIRESKEGSLPVYMKSLQRELMGCKEFVTVLKHEPLMLTLVSILQYLIDNPDTETADVRREVFRSIEICNKLEARFSESR